MSKRDLAISVRGLSKEYSIVQTKESHSTLAEALLSKLNVFSDRKRMQRHAFQALTDVSFDVHKGEVIGVIGRNGAGKSTLLKVLSRITEPTSGTIDLFGRVGSLLEVGTGFHPELTGRENIFLNGTILGMSRAEIRVEFDNIVEFAGVEKFLETPVKRYSSGMYVRLAFAVAAHLRSEILVVDEVLAVGDAAFQKKCLGKMHEVATHGRTVFLVSHHTPSIKALCSKAAVLSKGSLLHFGSVARALEIYNENVPGSQGAACNSILPRKGTGELRFSQMSMARSTFQSAEPKLMACEIQSTVQGPTRFDLLFLLKASDGTVIAQLDSRLLGMDLACHPGVPIRLRVTLTSPWLKAGQYCMDAYICGATAMDEFVDCCSFEVTSDYPYRDSSNPQALAHGLVAADFHITAADTLLP